MPDLVPAVAEEGNYSQLLSHLLLYFCLLSTMLTLTLSLELLDLLTSFAKTCCTHLMTWLLYYDV